MSELPLPGAEASAVSAALLEKLRTRITQHDGCLPFDDFMAAALYEPGLGYYSNGLTPFGDQGDFVTAPESGSLFGRCLAQCIASVLKTLTQGVVMELGAGSGVLAADLLDALQQLDCLPERYYILERSAAMRALQEATLARRVPQLAERVEWLTELPVQPVNGVIFGNEVADALPVKRFCWSNERVTELGVTWQGDKLSDCDGPGDVDFQARVQALAQDAGWGEGYSSEYCPSLPAWISSLADCLTQGLLLMIDYGYGRAEYYHAQRVMGTLICHYRHNAHSDPFFYPGLQDITAFVDFTAIAEAASDCGMQLKGYTSQAQFLVGCGIDRLLAEGDPDDARRFLQLSNEAKRLLLPGEMGERFKAIGFVRDMPGDVTGFSVQDLRSRL